MTGWSRAHWAALADTMLLAVRAHASPGHAQIVLPGPVGGYGRAVDGLEGFARTFLLAAIRLAGDPSDRLGLAEWYAAGIAQGCDQSGQESWIGLREHPQAKVEAASIALGLDLTRRQIWDRLAEPVRQRLVDYLAPVVGDTTYPRNNWLWFRIVVETFLRSVDGPWSPFDIAQDLALHDSFGRPDGWLADGDGRDFDHYTGWALHLYPTLWQRMRAARDLADQARRDRDRAALDRYLLDAAHLVGADGGPLIQGRSLIYRFAAAAPFWVGALADVPSSRPGALRRAASGIAQHFVAKGGVGADGVLSIGWHRPWPALAQAYSGPSSPYWAAKGFLGLILEPGHPAWQAVEEPLPVERGDFVRAIAAPGWLAHARAQDGLVQVSNHGTDHARPGDQVGDSPLYARLGYSTATSPLLDEAAWAAPLDQSACLVDAAGRASHRAGFSLVQLSAWPTSGASASRPPVDDAAAGASASRPPVDGPDLAVAVSTGLSHWLAPDLEQQRHGSGWTGRADPAGRLTVVSLVRSAWEVRGVHLGVLAEPDGSPEPAAAGGLRLRVGGWAVAGDETRPGGRTRTGPAASCAVTAGALTSWVADLTPGQCRVPSPGLARRADASPLGRTALVPHLDYPAVPGAWVWVLVGLARAGAEPGRAELAIAGDTITVTWPDGRVTATPLEITSEQPVPALAGVIGPGAQTE
jgi:hypothetical protein